MLLTSARRRMIYNPAFPVSQDPATVVSDPVRHWREFVSLAGSVPFSRNVAGGVCAAARRMIASPTVDDEFGE